MTENRGSSMIVMLAVVGALVSIASPAAVAQVPDEFTNLKVLPSDTPKADLINTMKGFAMGLGVRCWFCHKGEGDDLSTYDFASDEKPNKAIAREMLKMVMLVNKEYIAKLPAEEHERSRVRCITCHRGQSEPKIDVQ